MKYLLNWRNIALSILFFFATSFVYKSNISHQLEWKHLTGIENSHTSEDSRIDLSPFLNVVFFDENNGIAITSSSINCSHNSGKSWIANRNLINYSFSSLLTNNQNKVFIVGKNSIGKSVLLTSEDKGTNWLEIALSEIDSERLTSKIGVFQDMCFISAKQGWILGNGGIVELDYDLYNSHVGEFFSTDEPLNAIACDDDDTVWAVSSQSLFSKQSNVWRKINLDSHDTVFEKVKSNKGGVWLFGIKRSQLNENIEGVILKSVDKGETWKDISSQVDRPVNDIHISNETGWLVGWGGTIYYTKDNGVTWNKTSSPSKNSLQDIFFLNNENIWISGDNLTILQLER